MTEEGKAITLMSFIDESIARIFLQATPLREAVLRTLDLDSTEKKIEQFETYAKSAWEKIVLESQDKSFLQEEIQWSLSQCKGYLRLLEVEDGDSDSLKIESRETVTEILKKYKRVLTDFTIQF